MDRLTKLITAVRKVVLLILHLHLVLCKKKMNLVVWHRGLGVGLLIVVVIHIIAVMMSICKNVAQRPVMSKRNMG